MIELDRHIEILLLSNDCVIVPDLGGFMAHHVDARFDERDNMFVPPIRTLGFNPQLRMNDSLLVQSYIEAYDISYPEALRRIESEVEELRSHLEADGMYELNDIGILRLNEEGKIVFSPCESGILTPTLYGLSSFEMKLLDDNDSTDTADAATDDVADSNEQDDTVAEGPTPHPSKMPEEGTITIKMSWLRNALAAAAAILAFFMISTPIPNSDGTAERQQSAFISMPSTHKATPAATNKAEKAEATEAHAEAPMAQTADETLPTAQAEGKAPFCIVMASQVSEKNANTFITQMEEAGFDGARILVSGAKNIRRVIYGSYASEQEAATSLRELRKQSRMFSQSWVMEVK